MKKSILLLAVIVSALAVIAYEFDVSRRNEGRGTHVGGDVIIMVYACSFTLLTAAIALAGRIRKAGMAGPWILLSPIIPLFALSGWLWLHQSGRVSEYRKSMKNEPNKAVEPIPVAVTSCADAHLAPSTSMAHF